MNENDSYLFDVETPTDWTFPAGKTWVAGWFLSKKGAVFRDIRLRVGDRIFAGIFGQPRPDIEKRYRGHAGMPHAGFSFLIEPGRGAKLLQLEILDHGNHWVEIWRKKIRTTGSRAARPELDHRQVADVLATLLKAVRADPAADRAALARRLVVEAATEPLDVKPSPPFWGALEEPSNLGHSQFGKVPVTGWLIHTEQAITRLVARADPQMECSLVYGQPRDDAIKLFPQHPQGARSGFYGLADMVEHRPNPAAMLIFAELADGTQHLVFHQHFRQLHCNHKEQPYPAFSRPLFYQIGRELRAACRAEHIRLGGLTGFFRATLQALREYEAQAPQIVASGADPSLSPYQRWLRHNQLAPVLLARMQASATELAKTSPALAVLADLRGVSATQVSELVASLRAQIFPSWELWLTVPPNSGELARTTRELAAKESRVHVKAASAEADYVATLNACASETKAAFLALVPGHGRLAADALLHVAEAIAAQPALALIYSDEDRMDDNGTRHSPNFKGAWNPELALSGLFPGHLAFVARDAWQRAGGLRAEFGQVLPYDLLLRVSDGLRAAKVHHVPFVAFHARAAVAVETDPTDRAVEEGRRALNETLQRRGMKAEAFLPEAAHKHRRRFHQPRWNASMLAQHPVTVVIPTRDKLHLLEECVELLESTVDRRYVQLIIVDDHSRDADAVRYLETIQRRTDFRCRVVRPADHRAPFNYSGLMNLALPLVETPLILHLNNDVNALEPGWLEDMVGWITQPGVGVVGAKLIFPDRTLNHTGIVIGPHGGLADAPFARKNEDDVKAFDWHSAARDVSAVTGACLLTPTALYRQLGGFDERDFSVAYNDVDYCLRVLDAGQRVVVTPQAKLMHWGSATRGVTYDEAEHIAFARRYHGRGDAFVGEALELRDGGFAPKENHYAHARRSPGLRLLLITHNLKLEGAPLFLLEYAAYQIREAGFTVRVLAAEDGPLRRNFEELGATVTVLDPREIYAARSRAEFFQRIDGLQAKLELGSVDLVVCNTLLNFWGVHLAQRAGKASLFYLHESSSIKRFFSKSLPEALLPLVEEAFGAATRALFLCRATEAYYQDYERNGNFRIVPSWIKLAEIDAFRAQHSRAALRAKYGYGADEVIVANIGTVCERKGQHTFIRAVEHFNHHPIDDRRYRFLLVGGRASAYQEMLIADIRALGVTNIDIVPATRDVYDFFALSDLFVCSSFEESFPRVVLEAMAFRTPIVSTDVHGIRDMLRNRAEAYLMPPGDAVLTSQLMRTCLAKERSGKSFTGPAYSKVLRYYDSERVLPFHADLAREAFLDNRSAP
jgi:glycosyltransferase involved in cell wall biosynthesis